MDPERRLTELNEEGARVRTEIRVLEEQVLFQTDVAEDARIRAVVSGTPLADRESREAAEDLARMQRSLADARERAAAIAREQDELLDRIAARNRNG
ncbi:MAG TPA: hypothetical protein VGB83_00240 [Actinomycetota bacterium]